MAQYSPARHSSHAACAPECGLLAPSRSPEQSIFKPQGLPSTTSDHLPSGLGGETLRRSRHVRVSYTSRQSRRELPRFPSDWASLLPYQIAMIVATTCRPDRRDRGLNGLDLRFHNSRLSPHSSANPMRVVMGHVRAPSYRSAWPEL
ncbi:hypothetical protein Taro_000703 [Colocasia esculenta]|uniref:Uncharacterized protein n=1 Tax=Colocasia esculenta TaxID=4460 RepID=A0A843T7Y1_COLES|nr:hypothetical protein [Colocasia esculenta]